ncbi:hypothetical protein MWN52_09630 [Pseudoxanthomonas winnipegensis]|uniref:hypothetical protein n=1 Tax=Pseudoxanthomonas winnipegensis TaxID=2480810 RepID=UPI002574CEEE|nr:hypothetical protein [Pseudoxanthomonas winnipegensis]WJI17474.1 hypothetical protein MWN52_09630 [Pseudoxanthomonas winnipegensis]
MLANAIARRIAYVLVASVALAMCGRARAADYPDQGAAYAACMQEMNATKAQVEGTGGMCNGPFDAGAKKFYECRVVIAGNESGSQCGSFGDHETNFFFEPCPADKPWDEATHTCKANKCEAGKQITVGNRDFYSGTTECRDGCTVVWSAQDQSGFATGTLSGGQCDPNDPCPSGSNSIPISLFLPGNSDHACQPETCPPGMEKIDGVCKKKNECPAGQHVNPKGECENDGNNCPAGQTKAPDGSCTDNSCPSGQAKGKDGTCKKDSDGDGTPDGEGEGEGDDEGKQFSGGDSCDTPPSCAGDAIACGQARIQWRIDCNTRADTKIVGGGCDAIPVCSGKNCKADEYAQLLMQWRTACAVEKLAKGDGAAGDPNVKKIADAITGTGDIGEDGSPAGAFSENDSLPGGNGAGGEAGELDQSGFGWGRSCPTIPDVNVMGTSLHFDTSVFCQWVNLGGQLVLVLASLMCLRIISSGPEG